jgi:hypothetical protein
MQATLVGRIPAYAPLMVHVPEMLVKVVTVEETEAWVKHVSLLVLLSLVVVVV